MQLWYDLTRHRAQAQIWEEQLMQAEEERRALATRVDQLLCQNTVRTSLFLFPWTYAFIVRWQCLQKCYIDTWTTWTCRRCQWRSIHYRNHKAEGSSEKKETECMAWQETGGISTSCSHFSNSEADSSSEQKETACKCQPGWSFRKWRGRAKQLWTAMTTATWKQVKRRRRRRRKRVAFTNLWYLGLR